MPFWNRNGFSVFLTVPLARCIPARHSSTKLFVGGLSYDTNETVLKDCFGRNGHITEVKVICDHVSGKSKGYGFVQFSCEAAADAALKEMDGQLLEGRNIRVEYAREERQRWIVSDSFKWALGHMHGDSTSASVTVSARFAPQSAT